MATLLGEPPILFYYNLTNIDGYHYQPSEEPLVRSEFADLLIIVVQQLR